MKKLKNIIFCNASGRCYWDNCLTRNFETILSYDVSWKEAKSKYPDCIKIEDQPVVDPMP